MQGPTCIIWADLTPLSRGSEGWLAKLDEPVRRLLLAHGRYDGRELTELLRAIRNVGEHWFQPKTAQQEAARQVPRDAHHSPSVYHMEVALIRRRRGRRPRSSSTRRSRSSNT
jgi:hypothetical protein